MNCPSCSSGDVRKLSLIYMSGTHDTTGVSRGVVLSESGLGVFRARRRSTHQSKLSKVAAPPPKWPLLKPLLYGVVGLLCLPLVRISRPAWDALFWSYCSVGMVYFVSALFYNFFRYPRALRKWESLFMCQRCGAIVEPRASGEGF